MKIERLLVLYVLHSVCSHLEVPMHSPKEQEAKFGFKRRLRPRLSRTYLTSPFSFLLFGEQSFRNVERNRALRGLRINLGTVCSFVLIFLCGIVLLVTRVSTGGSN